MQTIKTDIFLENRNRLIGIAYRMLGSYSEAEDAVQETYIRWQEADSKDVRNPAGWLTTVCTRYCLDQLKSAHNKRLDYVGPWLPEPVSDTALPAGESELALASSLSTAFMLLLERLTPKERAAYLLHEIFEHEYRDTAAILDIKEPACRKLVSRAKEAVGAPRVRSALPEPRKQEFLDAFLAAIQGQDASNLAQMLAEDVKLTADGGGIVTAASRPLVGRKEVQGFIDKGLVRYWQGLTLTGKKMNGDIGLLVQDKNGSLHASVSFAVNEHGLIDGIFIMRNPQKLKYAL